MSSPGFDYGGLGKAVSSIFSGAGGLFAAGGYDEAAKVDEENAAIVKRTTGIQLTQADRQAYQVLGTTQAAAAGNGFSLSGSSLDLLKSNAQQLSLDKQVTANQGQIDENGWLEKAAANRGAAQAAQAGGAGDIASGLLQAGMLFL